MAMRSGAPSELPFGYCLNTSTIKGCGVGIVDEVRMVAEAGYDGIEPWIAELDAYVGDGGDLDDLGKVIADAGLSVPNAIGFFEWVVDDEARRAEGMTEARRNLDMARRIGAERLAAPPMGATQEPGLCLFRAAERYAELLRMGREFGVVPMVEFWGVSRNLGRLSEAMFVALECGERDACVLADVFHTYKSGGSLAGFRLLGPETLGLVHMNDYPADPPRETVKDSDRVFPGDGDAPLGEVLRDLRDIGYRGLLSLELFNESYWQKGAGSTLATGLEKMSSAVEAALSGGS